MSLFRELGAYYGLDNSPVPLPLSPSLLGSPDSALFEAFSGYVSGSEASVSPKVPITRNTIFVTTPVTPFVTTPVMSSPTFVFCGKFNGKNESASRWLKLLDYELASIKASSGLLIQSHLQYIDLLLQGEAVEWAELSPEAIRLLGTLDPSQETLDQFITLFKQRFLVKVVEVAPITFEVELLDLK